MEKSYERNALMSDATLIRNLADLVRRLALALREVSPNHPLPESALNWLARARLPGSLPLTQATESMDSDSKRLRNRGFA